MAVRPSPSPVWLRTRRPRATPFTARITLGVARGQDPNSNFSERRKAEVRVYLFSGSADAVVATDPASVDADRGDGTTV